MITRTFQMIVLAITIAFFAWVVSLLKKRRLELKYTLLWLACGLMMLVMCLFPQTLNWISYTFGVYNPTNALFAIISLFLILLCLSLTIIVSRLNESVMRLTQRLALLEKRNRELQDYKNRQD